MRVRGQDDRRHGFVVGIEAPWTPNAQSLDRRGVGEVDPGHPVAHGRHHVGTGGLTPVSGGRGFFQSIDWLAISKPSELYSVIAWFGLRPSTPR
jgi:hypothetical protein